MIGMNKHERKPAFRGETARKDSERLVRVGQLQTLLEMRMPLSFHCFEVSRIAAALAVFFLTAFLAAPLVGFLHAAAGALLHDAVRMALVWCVCWARPERRMGYLSGKGLAVSCMDHVLSDGDATRVPSLFFWRIWESFLLYAFILGGGMQYPVIDVHHLLLYSSCCVFLAVRNDEAAPLLEDAGRYVGTTARRLLKREKARRPP